MTKQQILDWIGKFGDTAKQICEEEGVPYQICWAQAILESGKGTNILAQHNNLWGIKYRKKYHDKYVEKWTWEYLKQGKVRVYAKFAVFDSLEDGVRGYCQFIKRKRYLNPNLDKISSKPLAYLIWIWGRGYATARGYVPAWVNRMQKIYRATGNEDFNIEYDDRSRMAVELLAERDSKKRKHLVEVFLNEGIFLY